jgi:hypothetical protein
MSPEELRVAHGTSPDELGVSDLGVEGAGVLVLALVLVAGCVVLLDALFRRPR